jgi:hypothetical protein
MEKHPLHLKIPELQTSDEVADAVDKQERLEGEALPNDPNARIEAYVDRLENIFLNPDKRVRERNLEMLRPAIYDAFLIKAENFPESYFELQKEIAREHGQAVEEIPVEVRQRMIETSIADQKGSLDRWIDYLSNPEDAVYPAWFKYFVFRNIVRLSQFDKTLGKFKDRTPTTVAPFPDVYRSPLAKILDIYNEVKKDNKRLKTDPEIQKSFSQSFPKLYAELISKSLAEKAENIEETKGKWVKYKQGDDRAPLALSNSVLGRGTGWCVDGLSTAEGFIEAGDFYVYYTEDEKGEPVQPRLAIQMNGDKIGQVRGILPRQEVEPLMQEVLDNKLKDFGPEADSYRKKSADMKRVTAIYRKCFKKDGDENIYLHPQLSKDDLLFLYEVNTAIEGFGYDKDPRIAEIRKQRNVKEDLPTIFDCAPDQIAEKPEEITAYTVAYIGPWNITVYKITEQFPNLTHLYESFPDKKIFKQTIETDPGITSAETAIAKLKAEGHKTNDYIDDLLTKVNWQEKLEPSYEVISFSVGDLFGDKNIHTYIDIKTKAQELGLDLVPQALAPSIRLNYPKNGEWTAVAMEAIRDRVGNPGLFHCFRHGADSWLSYDFGRDDDEWYWNCRFFLVRK